MHEFHNKAFAEDLVLWYSRAKATAFIVDFVQIADHPYLKIIMTIFDTPRVIILLSENRLKH